MIWMSFAAKEWRMILAMLAVLAGVNVLLMAQTWEQGTMPELPPVRGHETQVRGSPSFSSPLLLGSSLEEHRKMSVRESVDDTFLGGQKYSAEETFSGEEHATAEHDEGPGAEGGDRVEGEQQWQGDEVDDATPEGDGNEREGGTTANTWRGEEDEGGEEGAEEKDREGGAEEEEEGEGEEGLSAQSHGQQLLCEGRLREAEALPPEQCMFGYEPYGGRTLRRQVAQGVALVCDGGDLEQQHSRKTGGTTLRDHLRGIGLSPPLAVAPSAELKRRCFEKEWAAFDPVECFERGDSWAQSRVLHPNATVVIATARDPVSRLASEYYKYGPGNKGGIEAAEEGPWAKWMMMRTTSLMGKYHPNLQTTLLSGDCSEKKLPPPHIPRKYPWHRSGLCPECGLHHVLLKEGEEEMRRRLDIAKRTVVSMDLVIPNKELGVLAGVLALPLYEPGADLARLLEVAHNASNVNPSSKRVVPPRALERIVRESWADAELYAFVEEVYACKVAVYESLLRPYAFAP
eukprot:TRINITY_DN4244_c0_g1_i1.p1 TRINITY_DN4244_c0_g1~~TRINITY_DN4244_c0_g1_i1.p1  ORF type:complete len:516 (+),score=137.86 TRINITY_DN4244_c0_g1_i1:76-1623(+)